MKYLALALSMFFIPLAAHAQTLVTKDTANKYFNNCIAQPASEPFIGNGQTVMCACQAARMTQYFTMEDMKAMMDSNPAIARPAMNKMMIDVYAPCMGEPTRAYHYNQCMQNPEVTKLGNPQSVCGCMSDALATHMESHGSEIIANVLSHDPNIEDPMTAAYNDPGFQALAQSKLMSCLK